MILSQFFFLILAFFGFVAVLDIVYLMLREICQPQTVCIIFAVLLILLPLIERPFAQSVSLVNLLKYQLF